MARHREAAAAKYQGLISFPLDQLSCELEIAPWALDGRFQDLRAWKDGGLNWVDKPLTEGETKALAGLTAGSTFQDYQIQGITVVRKVCLYSCVSSRAILQVLVICNLKKRRDCICTLITVDGCILFLRLYR